MNTFKRVYTIYWSLSALLPVWLHCCVQFVNEETSKREQLQRRELTTADNHKGNPTRSRSRQSASLVADGVCYCEYVWPARFELFACGLLNMRLWCSFDCFFKKWNKLDTMCVETSTPVAKWPDLVVSSCVFAWYMSPHQESHEQKEQRVKWNPLVASRARKYARVLSHLPFALLRLPARKSLWSKQAHSECNWPIALAN